MKILICNTLEKKGGAAKSTNRIYESLKNKNVDIEYYYLFKDGQESKSLIPKIDAIPKKLFTKAKKLPFSSSLFSFGRKNVVRKYNPDILHLNYINMGMFSIKEIGSFNIPIVWTLHDSWAFTGGCHLPNSCERYNENCGNCSVLSSKKSFDLSSFIFSQKEKQWKNKNIHIVCPSKWIMSKAKESSLFPQENIHLIPNPINTEVFKPFDKTDSRQMYNLDSNKKYVLFGSVNPFNDRNKGFHLLVDALKKIDTKNVELLVFGSQNSTPNIDINIPVRNIGFIEDENRLAHLYSAADLTVMTSISENLPNVLIESLACGTPCLGFDVGGIPEIINKEILGNTVKAFDITTLAKSIETMLKNNIYDPEEIHNDIKKRFDYDIISEKYIDLYNTLAL